MLSITQYSTFIKEKTLTNCSFNMADISMSNLAASNWLTLDIEIGIDDCPKDTHEPQQKQHKWKVTNTQKNKQVNKIKPW